MSCRFRLRFPYRRRCSPMRLPDGTIASAQVLLGKRQIKRGTTRSILRLLQISEADFDRALR